MVDDDAEPGRCVRVVSAGVRADIETGSMTPGGGTSPLTANCSEKRSRAATPREVAGRNRSSNDAGGSWGGSCRAVTAELPGPPPRDRGRGGGDATHGGSGGSDDNENPL